MLPSLCALCFRDPRITSVTIGASYLTNEKSWPTIDEPNKSRAQRPRSDVPHPTVLRIPSVSVVARTAHRIIKPATAHAVVPPCAPFHGTISLPVARIVSEKQFTRGTLEVPDARRAEVHELLPNLTFRWQLQRFGIRDGAGGMKPPCTETCDRHGDETGGRSVLPSWWSLTRSRPMLEQPASKS